MPDPSLGSSTWMFAFLDLDCIPRSFFCPLPLGSEWGTSFSFLLPLPTVRTEHLCTSSLPTWEEVDGGYGLCPSRSARTLRVGSLCLIGPNVILIGSHLLNEWRTLCQSPSSTSSPSVFRWGWCPWNGRDLLFSLTSCFFFYLLLGYVNGVEEMEFKMRVPSLLQQKKTEALRLYPWRGLAFTSHLPASRWWVIALQRRRFQWYTLPSRWEEVWGSCVSGLEEEIIVFR